MPTKIEIVLFMAIRNNTVLPIGLEKGKSIEEINRMSYATMQELLNGDMIDWEMAERSYLQGKKSYLKNSGKES